MRFSKSRVAVFVGSAVVVLYGASAAFYGRVVAKDDAYKEIAVFMDALEKINHDYVEAPDMTRVQEGAMRGLIEALDPYSTYLSKSQLQSLDQHNGKAGVGLVLSKRADVLYVVATRRDGAADVAGIRPGDYLIGIDSSGVEDKSIIEVEGLLRGEPDSKVKLTLFRGARTKPVDIEVVRKLETTVPVVTELLDGGVGVLDVSSLAGEAVSQTRLKLKTLVSAGAQKLILDLRDCADGKVSDGAELANMFLKSGLIYYSQNRQGEKVEQMEANPAKFAADLPLVVLVNGSTAGPAEIVAGALQDQHRATVVGERSFGSGSAQTRIPLKSGAVLLLSTAKYYTPSGRKIQDDDSVRTTGIKPDVEAPDPDRHQDLLVESYFDEKDDAAKYRELREKIGKEQLNKALEVLSNPAVAAKKAA
jgi:carboxyl-terminal processing protease